MHDIKPDAKPRDSALIRGMTSLWRRSACEVGVGLPLISRVLAARGLHDHEAVAAFLDPSLKRLHDPSLMPDLDKAAQRLLVALRDREPIAIYGDYDVDGVTATAILWHTLKALSPDADLRTYVPHRIDEGYGLNEDAIRELAQAGAKVIISVDCGITAVQPALVARSHAVDLIITDHHNLPPDGVNLPDAYAIVHPRRPGSRYPFGELCGAGVAFKLAWRVATLSAGGERVPQHVREVLLEMLPLASMGVVADVVPLVDENRVIASWGLPRIRASSIEGLKALVRASGLDNASIDAEAVGFRLGPRLNACGRMGHAREAVELLTTARGERANEIAQMLTLKNEERRSVEKAIFDEAQALAHAACMTGDDVRAIVLSRPGWHAGVVGIVCSRLVERFHRPTILLGEQEGVCHGSGRSVDGFPLADALAGCSAHLLSHGGHDMAAGLKLRRDLLDTFVGDFTRIANAAIGPDQLHGRAGYDCEASIGELSIDVVRELRRLGPFGRENPPITLMLSGARIEGRPQTMGRENAHLSMHVRDTHGSRPMRVVGWQWGRKVAQLAPGSTLDLLIRPGISTFGGGARVECELVDIRMGF